ncbi:Stk1 family PASTA domain-containing Ser/Thr kinase [Aeromicrobium terrae]|uniref:non-specific serine/threonine protein kinase n=1 Tax=Aeromicrobium terrae TaxID=2498846 RepID=A0A5C8NEV1_9ACTN|nr:Stk1 family PASTA domain-containing Ser/Thr kinase [Aeromicrobium terrae]TXL57433.1 Stk1 family PASTA domain-containing Ser/Thr kinase [Aeromicrobium terrae]
MTDDETIRLGDRYELGGLLGRGGMADVRVGRDLRLGRTVAIKQLRSDLASDDTFQARFRREAQSAAALNHPSIVAVYDTGEATDAQGNHVPYIVMEYVEGQTLREIMRDDRKILPERALSITADVLSALDYSHRSGIIHRDIKPANVMLTPEGKVKVMDFGIARAIADASSAMTQTAAVIGTAQYLSPEQARGETVDARSDIYSTGCLLYELLTGRPPFVGESPVSVAYQHVREDARPPSQLNPDVSTAVDHIVAKALAKRTDDRYQSADEMRRDIERALAGHHVDAPTMAVAGLGAAAAGATAVAPAAGGTGTMPPVSHRDDDEAPDRKALWIGLAVLAVIILGLVGWGIYQASQPDDVTQVKVPDVAGQDVETATRALENAKFVVGETTEQTSADVDKGQVISTDPEAGSEADEGSTVDLVVSSGPEQVSIPSLDGYSYDRAKKLLESDQYGLKVKKATQDSNEPKDSVLNSDPPAGQSVDKGSTVTLIVSKGQATVPNVVGADQATATKTLEDAGFKVKVTEDPNAQGPEGQVTAQSVPAGEQRSPGTTIEITVVAKQDQGDTDGGDVLGGDDG